MSFRNIDPGGSQGTSPGALFTLLKFSSGPNQSRLRGHNQKRGKIDIPPATIVHLEAGDFSQASADGVPGADLDGAQSRPHSFRAFSTGPAPAETQSRSGFFARLPPEIHQQIYNQLWDSSGPVQHVHRADFSTYPLRLHHPAGRAGHPRRGDSPPALFSRLDPGGRYGR